MPLISYTVFISSFYFAFASTSSACNTEERDLPCFSANSDSSISITEIPFPLPVTGLGAKWDHFWRDLRSSQLEVGSGLGRVTEEDSAEKIVIALKKTRKK